MCFLHFIIFYVPWSVSLHLCELCFTWLQDKFPRRGNKVKVEGTGVKNWMITNFDLYFHFQRNGLDKLGWDLFDHPWMWTINLCLEVL